VSTPTGPGPAAAVAGITEADIAEYLVQTPGFFERQAELLANVQLVSPHGQRAVSLQERQIELMRERHRNLERKIVEMLRHGQENVAIADRLHRWTCQLMLARDPAALPEVLVAALQHEFLIPQAAIRVWAVDPVHAERPFAAPVSADLLSFAASLTGPYCGANTGFEAAAWLGDKAVVASMAMIPLNSVGAQDSTGAGRAGETMGLLVLGSPDPTRFAAAMGTEFLQRIGELASAALARLRSAG
jgi:uncharacterized protein